MTRFAKSVVLIAAVSVAACSGSMAPIKQTTAPAGLTSAKDVFAYYDKYVDNYKKKNLASLTGCWARDFTSKAEDEPAVSRARALKILQQNLSYKGKYTNGPDEVFVGSITEAATTITVKGYQEGSWRILDKNDTLQYTDNGNGQKDAGGMSFSEKFMDVWTKATSGWVLSKQTIEYKELDEKEYAAMEAAHKKLKAKYAK